MAKNIWDEPIGKNTPWDGDASTNNLPVRGRRIEEFLKGSLNEKIGELYYDTTNNRYLAFADEEDRDAYLENPTLTELVIAAFDAPFNYTAEINLAMPSYNAIFIGASGNYIDFTFDIKNKQGASTGESVVVKYTFVRGTNKQEASEIKPFGSPVHFNVDKYLAEGTNTVIVSVTGQTTLAATSIAITYEVVNLKLTDELDISKHYDLTNGSATAEVPYSISGYGTKIVEWYLDGVQLPYVKTEDEIVDSNTSRVKRITLSNLSQGRHSLQYRAYTTVNGERFYTDTLYRDLMVYTSNGSSLMFAIAMSIPTGYGIVAGNADPKIYGLTQYVPYTLRFATYSPKNTSNTLVTVKLGSDVKGTLNSNNDVENNVVITPSASGTQSVSINTETESYSFNVEVKPTSMSLREITDALAFNFTTEGKTNGSPDREVWTDGTHTATLRGFAWNDTSGWVGNRLEMTAGSSIEFNYAPLFNNPTSLGKTIEVEWATKNVTDDNAIVCDLRNSEGIGIVIYATKVEMTSADGVTIATEYKSDENVRIAFVINRATGSTHQCMSFLYANGVVSRGEKWAVTDIYTSTKKMTFTATDGAEVSLKAIRVYDTALSSDNILNNYNLYRDTIEEMMEIYDRNDVYEEGRDVFSPTKMASRLPVMIVTGDIPTLENTSDKDTQITVDIEYINMQDPSRSFKMEGAAMRPQGTSSMGYPKKNFRIYTTKLDNTKLYDNEGNEVKDKLYAFKKGSQPVDCWCLKADYAESSGTHNTAIARLWNEALYDAQIDGEYKLRTEAQRIAAESDYKYDVRTTIDGFPILLFYRPSANDDVIFIGKYNFNNDKSTESVFGFEGIPNFDNSMMQCWEVLNNGNPLALFTTIEGFNEGWSEAFESRYPDTKTPDTSYLKSFCSWMSKVSQSNFATQKWEHLDVYKMAAYWVYLMRHAAADQFVKNAMFTTEDGQHFYYILYDNDTINGLINTGHLAIKPTDTRQTKDESGSYVFAGHDSRLWNMLEADKEFMDIVSVVDNALYSAGISYDNTIKMFDEEQADKWVEKVYNQDATYKYISPYVEKGINNLFMLQGKRDLHRRWWLAKRFAIYDAKYVSGQYKSLSVELKCINGTPKGQSFSITAGYPLDYGYGINNLPREYGVSLNVGESHTFRTSEVVNLGDPIRIYGAPNIAELDLSPMAERLAVVTIANVYEKALGTKLTKLVVGREDAVNLQVAEISGLRQAQLLEHLDIQGMMAMTSLDLSSQPYFKTLKAHNAGIASVTFAKGAPVERLELPASMRVLALEQLPLLDGANIVMEDIANVQYISIKGCPNVSNDFGFVYDWYKSKYNEDANCSLIVDNVSWDVDDVEKFIELLALKNGREFSLKGVVRIGGSPRIEQIVALQEVLGDTAFDPNAELYVDVPTIVQIESESAEMLEGDVLQMSVLVYPNIEGTASWSVSGREGATINDNGLLSIEEKALDEGSVVVECVFTNVDGETATATKSIVVKPRTYPSEVTILGNEDPRVDGVYHFDDATVGVNGVYNVEWLLEGDVTNYWSLSNVSQYSCEITKKATMVDNTSGVLTVIVRRAFDGEVVATATKTIAMSVIFPSDATIIGDTNPANGDHTYTWSTSTSGVNGEYNASWALTGDITTYVSIKSQDKDKCVMEMLDTPTDPVTGTLTLTLTKAGNGATITTATKTLEAMLEGVIITKTSNPGVQAALYNAGLVANENYSLKEEVEKITADQLQPGTSASTSIFYSYRGNIKSFKEFKYFTGVTKLKPYVFNDGYYNTGSFIHIALPTSVTTIEGYALQRACQHLYFDTIEHWTSLNIASFDSIQPNNNVMNYYINEILVSELVIPEGVTSINRFFATYGNFKSVYVPDSVSTIKYASFHKATIGELLGCKNVSEVNENSEYPAFYDSNVTNIDKDVPFSIVQYDLFKVLSRRYKNTRYTYSFDNDIMALLLGNVEFITKSGAYFSDMTTTKTITLTQTGGIQNLTERLKIGYITLTISSNKSDAQFRIDYTDINSGEDAYTTVGVGRNSLPMKPGTSITVTAITEYEGFVPSGAKTVKSVAAINSVTMDYVEKTDIYIQHIDGTLYTTDEWTAGGYTNDQANGVAVVCASTSFVVSKSDVGEYTWHSDTTTGLALIKTSDKAALVLDKDGLYNTEIMLKTDVSGAAYQCSKYVFPNGKTGYLPSYGEMTILSNNYSKISSALSIVGANSMTVNGSYYWVSAQYSNTNAWQLSCTSGSSGTYSKASKAKVRAFTTL